MFLDLGIFIGSVAFLSYILYRQIKAQWFNSLLQKKMEGKDISHLTDSSEFDEIISSTIATIIKNYEKHKLKEEQKEDKKQTNNMYQ